MHRRALFAAALIAPALAAGAAQAAGGGGKERKKGGGATFVQIPTLTAGTVRADGRRGVLTVEAGVDAMDGRTKERVDALQPRLRDGYNTALGRYAAALRPGFAPDADLIARELQAVTDRVLAKKGVRLLVGTILLG